MSLKDEWLVYLRELQMPDPYIERVGHLHGIVAAYTPERLTDIFVSEYIDEEGSREFESCWLFGDNYVCELKSFTTDDRTDMAAWRYVKFIDIEHKDYVHGQEPTPSSRLKVKVRFPGGMSGDMRASGDNCVRLGSLIHDEFAPRIKRWTESRASLFEHGVELGF